MSFLAFLRAGKSGGGTPPVPSPSGTLTCVIAGDSYQIYGTRIHEKSGGEASTIDFVMDLKQYLANPPDKGDWVLVTMTIGAYTRSWLGTVEAIRSTGAEVMFGCLQLDAYLARKLVRGNYVEQDVGQTIADMIDDYGSPLTSTYVDTALGITAPLEGQYRTLLDHVREWAQLLGLVLWVDSDSHVHLVYPDNVSVPEYILYEAYS